MRKTLAVLMAMATIFAAFPSYALTPNLPHQNRSDVDDWVKIFIPYQPQSVDVKAPAGTVTLTPHSDSAGTPAGTNSAPALTMNAYQPGGTNSTPALTMNAYQPGGTNAASAVTITHIADTTGLTAVYANTAGALFAVFGDTSNHDVAIPAQTFTGTTATLTGSVAAPTFTGTTATLTGSVAAPTFTGTALGTHSHADTAVFAGTTGTLESMGAGTPAAAEVNSLGFGAVQMKAAGDDVHMIVPLPDNMCINCPMKISVAWSTNDTTPSTDTATWKVLYSAIAAGEALSAASTALGTAITADAISGVAYGLQESPQGIIAQDVLTRADTLHILAELDAVSGLNPASDEVFFHGIYIEYVREKL